MDKENIKVGHTMVRAMRRTVNENTGKVEIKKVHEGVVVQSTGSFVRVFNSAPLDRGGDVSQIASEMFPVKSPNAWCDVIGEKDRKFPVVAELCC